MWLTMRQFVAWHKQWEGMSEEEANAKWTADSANPDIRSIGDGAMKRLAVEGIPETEGSRGRNLERSLLTATTMENSGDLQEHLSRVMGFGGSGSLMSSEFQGMGTSSNQAPLPQAKKARVAWPISHNKCC